MVLARTLKKANKVLKPNKLFFGPEYIILGLIMYVIYTVKCVM